MDMCRSVSSFVSIIHTLCLIATQSRTTILVASAANIASDVKQRGGLLTTLQNVDLLLKSRISHTMQRVSGHCEPAYELSRMPEPLEPMHNA